LPIIGGAMFLLFLNNNSLFSIDRFLHNLFIFLSGFIYFLWIIFWYKKNSDNKKKRIFLWVLVLTIPLAFYLMTLGNQLGETEKIIFGFLPFLIIFPIYSFLINHKKDIFFRIIAILVAISAIGIVIISDSERFKSNRLICNLKKGDFDDNICRIDNLYTLKKSLYGVAIDIPEQYGYWAFLKKRKDGNLTGKTTSLAVDNGYKGEVTLFTDKINFIDTVRTTVIPFVVTHDDNKDYYLGFFEIKKNPNKNTTEIITHSDSYFIGRDIEIGKTTIKPGYYNNFLTQEIFNPKENTNKKIELRVGGFLNKFYLNEDCTKSTKIEEKTRGDGQSYKICIFDNGNQCEAETYKKGGCPIKGVPVDDLENDAEIYCRINGGMIIKESSTCAFIRNKSFCNINEYFDGKCEK
jgi:hypothetical protein